MHADGDLKGELYASRLSPERFGRRRVYALGKLAGRASVVHHLGALGLSLGPAERGAVVRAVVARGDEKRRTGSEDVLRLAEQARASSVETRGAPSAEASAAVCAKASAEPAAATRRQRGERKPARASEAVAGA